MDGAAAVIATGFSLFRNSVSWRGSDRKTDSLSDNKRRREKRGEREVARERERKRGRERQRWMKAIDSQCVRRRAMRKNLIPRLSSAVITISHCWREIWLISFSALEQVSSFLLSNFPQCSITVPRRGQRERERERERERNSKAWKTDERDFALRESRCIQGGINVNIESKKSSPQPDEETR